jgi:dipeptidyl aminopeptidase/acylaminoacyl peptidase
VSESSTTAKFLANRSPVSAYLTDDQKSLVVNTVEIPIGSDHVVHRASAINIATGDESLAPEVDPVIKKYATDDVAATLSPNRKFLLLTRGRGSTIDTTLPYRWTRPVRHFDATGELENPPQLQLVDVASGDSRWLTDDGWRWSTVRWSPNNDCVFACRSLDPNEHDGYQYANVISLDGTVRELPIPGGRSIVGSWLTDGRLAVLIASPQGRPSGSESRLYIVNGDHSRIIDIPHLFGDVYGDQPAELADIYDHLLLVHPDGSLIIRAGARGRMGILRVRIDEAANDSFEVLIEGDRCCSPVATTTDDLIFTTQSSISPVQIAVFNYSTKSERLLTQFAQVDTPPLNVTRFTVDTTDGFTLDAWFLAAQDVSTPLPTVSLIHGGPHFAYGEAFSLDAHALCAAGFGVLYTNVRGSTGYGDAFAHAAHSNWAQGPASDQLLVIERAIELGLADPDRLGVAGNSYGGYLSAWLVSTTSRFRAAVIENPVTDLVSMYGTSDIGATFFPSQFGGAPHERLDTYYQQSPIMHAHQCTTPCLFVIGENDRRCPPAQAWAMHRALCVNGTTSEVLVLPQSPHEGSTYGPPSGRLAHDNALVDWMTRWLN